MYNRFELAKEIKEELKKGYDPFRMARWAYKKFLTVHMEPEAQRIIKVLAFLENDSTIDFSAYGLEKLANQLEFKQNKL